MDLRQPWLDIGFKRIILSLLLLFWSDQMIRSRARKVKKKKITSSKSTELCFHRDKEAQKQLAPTPTWSSRFFCLWLFFWQFLEQQKVVRMQRAKKPSSRSNKAWNNHLVFQLQTRFMDYWAISQINSFAAARRASAFSKQNKKDVLLTFIVFLINVFKCAVKKKTGELDDQSLWLEEIMAPLNLKALWHRNNKAFSSNACIN